MVATDWPCRNGGWWSCFAGGFKKIIIWKKNHWKSQGIHLKSECKKEKIEIFPVCISEFWDCDESILTVRRSL
jgi:hypothetical protein